MTLLCGTSYGQFIYTFVTNTNANDATAYTNGHKIAVRTAGPSTDTISIVYQDVDSIKYIISTNRGMTWQTPTTLGSGQYPTIDLDAHGYRHVVWQQIDTLTGSTDIMYDCLDDWGTPVNVSESIENSMLADVVVDDSMNAYIVWVEGIGEDNQILFRACHAGSLGVIEQVSPSWPHATHDLPSISIFAPNTRISVLWDCLDPTCYSPYQILYRYKENSAWSTVDHIYASYLEAGHSSLDFDHGEDSLSACYDYTNTGNNHEVAFYGGNGGGYTTPGISSMPVITTMGSVWSYLFWQEDSAGLEDIYFHLYYFVTGWTRGSIRTEFSINEPVRFPSSCGAYLVWTQGDNPPYSIYFADFGYPVGCTELNNTGSSLCTVFPNPFHEKTRIAYSAGCNTQQIKLEIYDVSGRSVKNFPHNTHDVLGDVFIWDGTDNTGTPVPAGMYFVVASVSNHILIQKVVKIE